MSIEKKCHCLATPFQGFPEVFSRANSACFVLLRLIRQFFVIAPSLSITNSVLDRPERSSFLVWVCIGEFSTEKLSFVLRRRPVGISIFLNYILRFFTVGAVDYYSSNILCKTISPAECVRNNANLRARVFDTPRRTGSSKNA